MKLRGYAERRTYRGQWRRGDDPEGRWVGGVLDIADDSRPVLWLAGELFDFGSVTEIVASQDRAMVHGQVDGEAITLVGCVPDVADSTQGPHCVTSKQTVRATAALVGHELQRDDEQIFTSARIELAHLGTWMGSGMRGVDPRYFGRRPPDPFFIAAVDRVDEPYARAHVGELVVEFDARPMVRPPRATTWTQELSIVQRPYITVSSPEPLAWDGFDDICAALQDLITLGVQVPSTVGSMTLSAVPAAGSTVAWPVTVRRRPRHSDSAGAELGGHTLFTLNDLDPADTSIDRWVQLRARLGLPLLILLGLDYMPVGFYENRIFNAAVAAEGIHAKLCATSTVLDPAVHAAGTAAITRALGGAGLDAETVTYFRERLPNNRPGFGQRCRELAQIPDTAAVTSLLTDVDRWAQWLGWARNGVAHGDLGDFEKKVPHSARSALTMVTQAVLHLVLMSELGISAAVQRTAVAHRWGHAAHAFGEEVTALA